MSTIRPSGAWSAKHLESSVLTTLCQRRWGEMWKISAPSISSV
ncbi:hypothetical protein FHS12_003309 [Nocardioides albus]|uniref:Uncharacterized protein n=1 Tax=Nocardioides albus TaxID=1841 RepID=A0A7W5F9S9_9ACTN|nr:hypothetical protein [Nocardioides albus]